MSKKPTAKERKAAKTQYEKEMSILAIAIVMIVISLGGLLALEHVSPRTILILVLVLVVVGGLSLFLYWLFHQGEEGKLQIDWKSDTIGG